MGSVPSYPSTDISCILDTGNSLIAGLAAMQGWRDTMEDEHILTTVLPDSPSFSLFAIFDGHGGSDVSKYLSTYVQEKLLGAGLNENMSVEQIEELIYGILLDIDCDLIDGKYKSGSTAIIVLFTPDHIITANVGDSRAIIYSGRQSTALSIDHKPWIETERIRIENAGGSVTSKRVNGELAVSRSFGDIKYKQREDLDITEQIVTAEPQFVAYQRREGDEFVVLACDGVWDQLTNDMVCNLINLELDRTHDPSMLATTVLNKSFQVGGRDNISCMIVLINDKKKYNYDPNNANSTLRRGRSDISGMNTHSHSKSYYNIKLVDVSDICL